MKRKTIILREDQFNEICGTNMAYLDNSNDYKEDGTVTTKTAGAVSDGDGEKEYSEPMTTDDYSHAIAPETLWHVLFNNGGHGLWGPWGTGYRVGRMNESNSELEGRTWNLDLDNDGVNKTYSYTELTTLKTELKKKIAELMFHEAPQWTIDRVKSKYNAVCQILDRETGAIKGRKTAMKNLGFENQFQKPGGSKNSGNGKAHTKKINDPNVGTGYITYS